MPSLARQQAAGELCFCALCILCLLPYTYSAYIHMHCPWVIRRSASFYDILRISILVQAFILHMTSCPTPHSTTYNLSSMVPLLLRSHGLPSAALLRPSQCEPRGREQTTRRSRAGALDMKSHGSRSAQRFGMAQGLLFVHKTLQSQICHPALSTTDFGLLRGSAWHFAPKKALGHC